MKTKWLKVPVLIAAALVLGMASPPVVGSAPSVAPAQAQAQAQAKPPMVTPAPAPVVGPVISPGQTLGGLPLRPDGSGPNRSMA